MAAADPAKMTALRGEIDDHDGVLCATMARLRDAYGAGKLGSTVVQNISRELAKHGLAHFPPELPADQLQEVLVYRQGTPVADVIHAVASPSPAGAATLRRVAQSNDAATLARIRELVCE